MTYCLESVGKDFGLLEDDTLCCKEKHQESQQQKHLFYLSVHPTYQATLFTNVFLSILEGLSVSACVQDDPNNEACIPQHTTPHGEMLRSRFYPLPKADLIRTVLTAKCMDRRGRLPIRYFRLIEL